MLVKNMPGTTPAADTLASDTEVSAAVDTPETQSDVSTSAPDDTATTETATEGKTAREIELEEQLADLQAKADSARKEARKAKDEKRDTQKGAGEYQKLYEELETNHAVVITERDTAVAAKERLEKEVKTIRGELNTYRTALIERFESDEHKALANDLPIAKIHALYESLYQGRTILPPPPSPGIARTATKVPATQPATLADFFEKKYSKNGS